MVIPLRMLQQLICFVCGEQPTSIKLGIAPRRTFHQHATVIFLKFFIKHDIARS